MDFDGFSLLNFIKGLATGLGIILFMWALIRIGSGGWKKK